MANKFTIGVPKEIKTDEYRVAMIPVGVDELTRAGHKVLIQAGAGQGSGISDEEYAAQGAELVEDDATIWKRADLIVKVKEPLPDEWPLMGDGQIVFTYFHFAADRALEVSQARTIRFLAARILVEAGAPERAKRLAISLGNDLQPESQAFASIIDGMIALADGDRRNAVRFLNDANTQLDTWIGHFELGRAYLTANAFPQADSEFERCLNRRGEALALFLDEEPTFGYFPMVHYYQGRAREGMKLPGGGAEPYRKYLEIREKAGEDPLIADIKKRIR